MHNMEKDMMTQPIQRFENLASETAPAGGNDIVKTVFTFDDRRLIELRARYARAEMLSNALGDILLWFGRQYDRVASALKADLKLRAAEGQLYRMSDRELADIGLARSDIQFAVRENAEGVAPALDSATHTAPAANENLRRVA